jgi:hypothetical protein
MPRRGGGFLQCRGHRAASPSAPLPHVVDVDHALQADKLVHLDNAITERLPLASANSFFNIIVAILIQDKR